MGKRVGKGKGLHWVDCVHRLFKFWHKSHITDIVVRCGSLRVASPVALLLGRTMELVSQSATARRMVFSTPHRAAMHRWTRHCVTVTFADTKRVTTRTCRRAAGEVAQRRQAGKLKINLPRLRQHTLKHASLLQVRSQGAHPVYLYNSVKTFAQEEGVLE